jgi:hypothetical protein
MLAQEGVAEFFSFATLGTLAGASAATVMVGNVVALIPGVRAPWPKIVGLIASLLIAYFVFVSTVADRNGSEYLIAFLNGMLVFATAYGLNESTQSTGSWD